MNKNFEIGMRNYNKTIVNRVKDCLYIKNNETCIVNRMWVKKNQDGYEYYPFYDSEEGWQQITPRFWSK